MINEIAWVFDFDNTVANATLDNVEHILNQDFQIEEINDITAHFLLCLSRIDQPIYILTARHPLGKPFLQNAFSTLEIRDIICRDFCLEMDDINKAYNQIQYHRQFL